MTFTQQFNVATAKVATIKNLVYVHRKLEGFLFFNALLENKNSYTSG
jgi:hypothetical protein